MFEEGRDRQQSPDCAKCPAPACYTPAFMQGPPNCPTKLHPYLGERRGWTGEGESGEGRYISRS
jgi:hypothetical protein